MKNPNKIWSEFADRSFMLNKLFPMIGKYSKQYDFKTILDIGIQEYNLGDKEKLLNNDIEFYGLDKCLKTSLPSDWNGMFYVDLTEKKCFPNNIEKYFNIIIDYGVLGWPEMVMPYNIIKLENYIENILYALKDDGLYFLKIDLTGYEGIKPDQYYHDLYKLIYKNFKIADFNNISNIKLENQFHCMVLSKKTKTIKNLMIVAHPDDESIFGGGALLSENNWKIICVTCGDQPTRRAEFENAMAFNHRNIDDYEMWNFSDHMHEEEKNWYQDEELEIIEKLKNVVLNDTYKKVVTHNDYGEYYHPQHIKLHHMIKKIYNNLHVFARSKSRLKKEILFKKIELLDNYKTQWIWNNDLLIPWITNEDIIYTG